MPTTSPVSPVEHCPVKGCFSAWVSREAGPVRIEVSVAGVADLGASARDQRAFQSIVSSRQDGVATSPVTAEKGTRTP